MIYLSGSVRPDLRHPMLGYMNTPRMANKMPDGVCWGTGGLNVDRCRVEAPDGVPVFSHRGEPVRVCFEGLRGSERAGEMDTETGRWPANVIHDNSEEVVAGFPDSAGQQGDVRGTEPSRTGEYGIYGHFDRVEFAKRDDAGSAARFFYTPKADAHDRVGSNHPTVKPVDLKQYLTRLITPKGGTVLDCFAGTGTTGEACIREGFRCILIEREASYQEDIRRRMRLALAGPVERKHQSVKHKHKDKPADHGPLFSTVRD